MEAVGSQADGDGRGVIMSALGELGSLRGKKPPGQKKDNLAGYLFLAPWLLGLFLITIGPMLASLYLFFMDYNLI